MKLIKKSMAIGLILLLVGCATPGPQIQVKRTAGHFDYKTRIYKNYEHNLQMVIPNYWTVVTGEALYRLPLAKEVESKGWESLVYGEVLNEKGFALVAMPWSDSIESLLRQQDSTSPDPPVIGLTTKEIKFGELSILERSGQKKVDRAFLKERAFVYKGFAYRLMITSFSPVSERDAEILENLKIPLDDKQSPPLEKKLLPPEKPQTITPVTPESRTNIIVVTGTSANIRSGAGNEFSIVTTVKKGDRLILIGEHGEWLNVRLENGQEGWINNRFVR